MVFFGHFWANIGHFGPISGYFGTNWPLLVGQSGEKGGKSGAKRLNGSFLGRNSGKWTGSWKIPRVYKGLLYRAAGIFVIGA